MRPTRLRLLLGVAVVAGVLVWAVLRAWETRSGSLPDLGWPTPAALLVVAVALLVTTLVARPRLRRAPGARPLSPLVSTRLAALALASSRVGAAAAGAYLAFGALLLDDLDTDYGRRRAVVAALAAVAALALAAAALFLENACRIREDDDEGDDDGDTPPRSGLGSPA